MFSVVLSSPGHPSNYPNNLARTDVIEVDQGLVIAIKFTAFILDDWRLADCSFDYLTITEGDGTLLMDKTCGFYLPPDIISTTNTVHVNFHTDGDSAFSGWRLEWTAVSPGCFLLHKSTPKERIQPVSVHLGILCHLVPI